MKGSNKFFAGILLGAAAGAVVALFLKSDKGKELIAEIKEQAEDVEADIKTKYQSFEEELKTLLNKGKAIITEMENDQQKTTT